MSAKLGEFLEHQKTSGGGVLFGVGILYVYLLKVLNQ